MAFGEVLANWGAYSLKTQVVTVAAGVLFISSFLTGAWSHFLRVSDQNDWPKAGQVDVEVTSTIKIEVHNHYPIGQKVAANDKLLDDWVRSSYKGRDYLKRVDSEIIDLGTVKVTTIAVLDAENVVHWRYRIFSIIEGAAWDVDSWTVFRNADGDELSFRDLLKNSRIKEQVDFSDIVFAIGLASNLKGGNSDKNLILSRKRAEWLAMAVAKFSMVSGTHHWNANIGGTPGESTIFRKVFMLPLGEAKRETEIGDPSEPPQRAAIIVGVDINERDPDLDELLSFVVAPKISETTDLSQYQLSSNPTAKLEEIKEAQGEAKKWPEDYSVRNVEE